MRDVRHLAEEYMGGLAHVHTKLSNYAGHLASDQTARSFVSVLVEKGLAGHPSSPFKFVMFNDHASNPERPEALGGRSLRARALARRRWHERLAGVPVLYGYEASLLPEGRTDLTWQLADRAELVIGSLHRLPPDVEGNAMALQTMLEAACRDPLVDVIGHPARHIEGLSGMHWRNLFELAAQTGTAIEVNLNSYPDERREPGRTRFWANWLRELERSEADVFIGVDIHNVWQREHFVHDWKMLGRPGYNHLATGLEAVADAGIGPRRVVNASAKRFGQWLELDKRERAHLVRARLAIPV